MIDDLSVPTSANFYSIRKKLSDKAIESLFVLLRANHGVTAHNEFKHTRQRLDGTRWSAVCFKYDSPPSFLEERTAIRESLCGLLLLVEYQGYVAVLSSRLSLPISFKTDHFSSVETTRVEGAIAKADAIFQRMTMRNMSISPYAMRTKTLEAQDLANVVGPAGSRRYAPRTYSVIADGNQSTATPSTGRIGIRSARADLPGFIAFAKGVIDELRVDNADISPFIRSFARPVSLTEALQQSAPITLAMDTNKLTGALASEQATIRLVRLEEEDAVELTAGALTALIEQLEQVLNIEGDDRVRLARIPGIGDQAASISLNKNRIALRSLSLPPASDVFVESLDALLGEDSERKTLREYLDEIDALIVLFDDVRWPISTVKSFEMRRCWMAGNRS
ncbi:hypothetical protein [Bradyrhizobium sp. 155]|uniref:hypothetical protein n=1 Tax=Bradyrhizobium sp. 155 TaxID=2782629 RepID=UPI001FFFD91D|nr:hypothetical protein [Bradyrhizobium sp. 155]